MNLFCSTIGVVSVTLNGISVAPLRYLRCSMILEGNNEWQEFSYSAGVSNS